MNKKKINFMIKLMTAVFITILCVFVVLPTQTNAANAAYVHCSEPQKAKKKIEYTNFNGEKKTIEKSAIFYYFKIECDPGIKLPISAEGINVSTHEVRTYRKGSDINSSNYISDQAIPLSMNFDKVIFTFQEDMVFPFYYYFIDADKNGNHIGKYLIDVDYTNKKITFDKIESTKLSDQFAVVPPDNNVGNSYFQAGAVLNLKYKDMSDLMTPMYKITAFEYFYGDKGASTSDNPKTTYLTSDLKGKVNGSEYYLHKLQLGNSDINAMGMVANNYATYPSCFVFCSSYNSDAKNNLQKDVYKILEEQKGSTFEFFWLDRGESDDIKTLYNDGLGGNDGNYKGRRTGKFESTTKAGDNGNPDAFNLSVSATPTRVMSHIIYMFDGESSKNLDTTEATGIEKIITKLGLGIGDIFLDILYKVCGEDLTIDSILFNVYNPTVLDYFGTRGLYLDAMKRIINGWYDAFRFFATFVIIVALVAIGVMCLLYVGTSKENKIRSMISGWVMAVILLYFGPYLMKYVIRLNDMFVSLVSTQSEYSCASIYNMEVSLDGSGDISGEYLQQLGEDSRTYIVDQLEAKIIEIHSEIEDLEKEKQELEAEVKDAQNEYKNASENFVLPNGKYTKYLNIFATVSYSDGSSERMGISSYPNFVMKRLETYGTKGIYYEAFKNPSSSIKLTPSLEEVTNIDTWAAKNYNGPIMRVTIGPDGEPIYHPPLDILADDYLLVQEKTMGLTQKCAEITLKKEELAKYEKFLNLARKNIDLMAEMRDRAGKTYRFIYCVVWFILISQLVALMILYYKRLLTVAVLIIIYPLIVMFYAIERLMGIDKPQAFSTWIKEYIANIFVQTIHALTYVMLVESGLKLYEANSDNWVLFVMAVMALYPAEAIIKNILGMKSSTVGNFTTAGKSLTTALAAGGAAISLGKAGVSVAKAGVKSYKDNDRDKLNKKFNDDKNARDIKRANEQARTNARRGLRDRALNGLQAYGAGTSGAGRFRGIRQAARSAIGTAAKVTQKAFHLAGQTKDKLKGGIRKLADSARLAKHNLHKKALTIRGFRTAAAIGASLNQARREIGTIAGGITNGLALGGTMQDMATGMAISRAMHGGGKAGKSGNRYTPQPIGRSTSSGSGSSGTASNTQPQSRSGSTGGRPISSGSGGTTSTPSAGGNSGSIRPADVVPTGGTSGGGAANAGSTVNSPGNPTVGGGAPSTPPVAPVAGGANPRIDVTKTQSTTTQTHEQDVDS